MSIKITIPKPCHENWNGMAPEEQGRFCSSCSKTVMDFTTMPRKDVERYLMQNRDKKVCGRFNNNQIDTTPVTLHIPREALYRQTSFRNIFLLALIISMGTTLFSCQKRTIGEVSIPEDTIHTDTTNANTQQQVVVQQQTDTAVNIVKPVNKISKEKIEPVPDNFIVGDIAIMPDTVRTIKDIYNVNETDIRPEFPGGIKKLYEYIISNLKPAERYEEFTRKIHVNFIIEKDGSVSTVKVLRGFDESENSQLINILKNSPKWTPAQRDNENVRVQYILPISIKAKE